MPARINGGGSDVGKNVPPAHLLGLGDDYPVLMPNSLFNWLHGDHSGHAMSNSLIRNPHQHEIDYILARKACKCKP